MGKHAASDGSTADPIVAEALTHRQPGTARHAAGEGPVGWPGEPAPEGGRVGWPGDLAGPAAPAAAVRAAIEPTARRGWRRLFPVRRVA